MLESIITSKTRLKLLLKFFINPETEAYLQELATEFDESSNGIRIELNRLKNAKLLHSEIKGRTVVYRANIRHRFFRDISTVVKKYVGIDRLIEELLSEIGTVEGAWIIGDYARGVDSGLIDLVLVGNVNEEALTRAIEKSSRLINRKIRPLLLERTEFDRLRSRLEIDHALLLWGE